MRRGRGGRPHLLCPPCPPIGRSGGTGAEPGTGEETSSLGADPGSPSGGKAARARRGRCAGQQASSSSSCQPRARRCHGRAAPALRALSGSEELCHRSARGARSQDRCREAVSGRGSRHSAKLVPSVRLRGISTVQPDRICVPRVCISQSHREPKQRRRYHVAHLLGGVRCVRPGGVLQRSTPVLVPFLLRGQVRLPVILHDAGTVERGSSSLSSRAAPTLPKAPRGRGQRREPSQRSSSGRGGRNNPGRQGKPEPAAEGQVKQPSSSSTDPAASKKGRTPGTQLPTEPSAESQAEPRPGPSSPSGPIGSPQSTASAESHSLTIPSSVSPGQAVSGSPSGSQLPRRIQPQRTGFSNSAPVPAPQPPTSSGTGPGPSTTSNLEPSLGQSASSTTTPSQPSSKPPSGSRPAAHKGSRRQHKEAHPPAATSPSVPPRAAPCPSESSLECSSESTAEIPCNWPHHRHQLPCPPPCWLLKHLAY